MTGKKRGKLSKIEKAATGVRIRLEPHNAQNCMIQLDGDGVDLLGIGALLAELPAEMSFFIPETYHKRIMCVSSSPCATWM